ncbi:MAG: aspartyl protease family protein [Planctomycetota bacterium]
MPWFCCIMLCAMLLIPPGPPADNPWKAKVPAALARVEKSPTRNALRHAFDVTWRADDWQAALKLAERARAERLHEKDLRGLVIRALWRGGRIFEAEALAAKLPADTRDRVALRMLIQIDLARGEIDAAERWAERLAKLRQPTAEDLFTIFSARFAGNRLAGAADELRRLEQLIDLAHGYPELHMQEAVEGVAAFLDAVGPDPLNQIESYGAAPMPPLVMFNLPTCEAMINGRGPYRLVVDTGGSIMLALDETVARDIGLTSVAKAHVRGVGGVQETGQALVDRLDIGPIRCRRVMTRVFDVHGAIMNAADGILGTGIFGEGRIQLDFVAGQFAVRPSGAEAGAGEPVELRLLSDAKLVVPIELQGRPGLALLDSGADVVALSPLRLQQLFPGRKIRTFSTGIALGVGSGDNTQLSFGSAVQLGLGGRSFANSGGLALSTLDDMLSPLLGAQLDALVGMRILREMRSVTVDFPRARLWVDWAETAPPKAEGTD